MGILASAVGHLRGEERHGRYVCIPPRSKPDAEGLARWISR